MAFNSIRTKIIGGYLLFVLLILSFLAVDYLLVTSTVRKSESVYRSSEWMRHEMEAENIFWRQVIAMTDYFLTGEEELIGEVDNYQKTLSAQMIALGSTAQGDSEKRVLAKLDGRYQLFLTTFTKAAALYRAGQKAEAIQVELREIDPLERDIAEAWEELLELRAGAINTTLGEIRANREFAFMAPSIISLIDSTEAIYNEHEALKHSLEAEENFLRQVVALTDLFAFGGAYHTKEFHEFGEVFEQELRLGQSFAERADEQQLFALIDAKHRAFTATFEEALAVYETGDHAGGLQVEIHKVDPAEGELEEALAAFYPLKQQNMKRSLENVLLVNRTSLSITRNLAVYVSLILMIGLMLGAVLAIRITGPTRQLAEATQRIAAGDFSARSNVKSGDEIGQLSRSFNRMAENLERTTVSKDYVNGIIESMADSLVVASADGLIVTVNGATCRMLGYTAAELIGRPLPEIFDREEPADQDGPLTSVESVYLARDGRHIPVAFSRTSMRLDSGQVGIVCVAKDITELKRATAAVRLSEHKLSLHIQQTPLAVIEWNLKAEIVEWNPAAEVMFGYSRSEALGAQIAGLLVLETDRGRVLREWKDLLAGKVGRHVTYENLTKDGRTIICEWYNTPLDSEGRVIGVASMVQDFTKRTEMEKELKTVRDAAIESARLKSEFLANMSHEIRTPMNGIIGMTGILLDTDLSPDQQEFAETIRSSGDALLTIINDILDFSKIEAGKLNFEVLDFDLSNAIESTVELLAQRAHAKHIELASMVYGDVPTNLRGDPGRLRQILTNLIGNAIKFTENGEVVVRAEKVADVDSEVVIRFTVTDTGIGITEKVQRTLFQAFSQADGSTTRKYGGTGLGLAISKQLVELMGGQIGVTSEEGKGATFWFTATFARQPFQGTLTQPDANSLHGLRALIVDDNATNRRILSHQLRSWGITEDAVDSGSRALESLRAAAAAGAEYELAILDLMMPGMDGFELARAIKSDPAISQIQLVLLTSFGQRGDGATSREAGVAAYFTKPVRHSQLFECLANVMGQRAGGKTPAAPESGSKLVTSHSLVEAKPMSTKLILLAEDNIVNQKVAVRQLKKLGYHADTVANGREALEALARVPYDLVLMDCQMPEMDGYEATAEIRRRDGPTRRTPIVAMTAHALDGDRAKCIAAGMDDYISKPVKPEELGRVLEKLLQAADNGVILNAPLPQPQPASPVNLKRLHEAMGDEPEEFGEILEIYLTQMSRNLEELGKAVKSENASSIELIAHNCAGTSANCGMTVVIAPLRELERMGREHQLTGAAVLVDSVGHEFERIKIFLNENLQSVTV